MAEKEKSLFDWLKNIRNLDGWILGAVLAILGTLGAFAVDNYSLPRDNSRIESIEDYIRKDEVEKAVMQNNIVIMKQSIEKLDSRMQEGFNSLSDKMDENNKIVKIVRENTK